MPEINGNSKWLVRFRCYAKAEDSGRMNLKEFFNSEFVQLPRGGFKETSEAFEQFLNRLFERYLEELQKIDDTQFPQISSTLTDLTESARKLAASIARSVGIYLSGRAHLAYNELQRARSTVDWSPFRSELGENTSSFSLSDPFSPYLFAILHPPLLPANLS